MKISVYVRDERTFSLHLGGKERQEEILLGKQRDIDNAIPCIILAMLSDS